MIDWLAVDNLAEQYFLRLIKGWYILYALHWHMCIHWLHNVKCPRLHRIRVWEYFRRLMHHVRFAWNWKRQGLSKDTTLGSSSGFERPFNPLIRSDWKKYFNPEDECILGNCNVHGNLTNHQVKCSIGRNIITPNCTFVLLIEIIDFINRDWPPHFGQKCCMRNFCVFYPALTFRCSPNLYH